MDSFYSFLPSQTIDIVSAGQTHKPATFLTFFAAAQRFGVLFLPFGWDAGRDNLGQGATSQVTEGLVDIQNSFAFKRTSPDKSADESFRALINEMAVLTHPAIRLHPLIPQLQGISWEICPGDDRGEEQVDEVWPVLVFEKSQLGDLWNMATLPVGREMSFDQRLDLCLDIATALHDIHVLNIVHGDIKPENVLIFQDESGRYQARLTDFGYSSRFMSSEDRLRLPISPPWNAPEVDRLGRLWTPDEAKRADMYSLGMLFVWILFEPCLYEGHSAGSLEDFPNRDAREFLSRKKPDIWNFSIELLKATKGVDSVVKESLGTFLLSCLQEDPTKRTTSVESFLKSHDETRIRPLDTSIQIEVERDENDEVAIDQSLLDLHICDYRVRKYLAQCLCEAYNNNNASCALPLAFCYLSGFGLPKDDEKAYKILQQIHKTKNDILEQVINLRSLGIPEYIRFRELYAAQHIVWPDDYASGIRKKNLQRAGAFLAREIKDAEEFFGRHFFGRHLRNSVHWNLAWKLAHVYQDEDRWGDYIRLLTMFLEEPGMQRPQTDEYNVRLCAILSGLVPAYRGLCQWNKAVDFGLRALALAEKEFGENHVKTLKIRFDLGCTYADQGFIQKSEDILTEVIDLGSKALGPVHTIILQFKTNLMRFWLQHKKAAQAEEMAVHLQEACLRILGKDHYATISIENLLATAYTELCKWDKALAIAEPAYHMSSKSGSLDADPGDTLGLIYSGMGRFAEAEALQERTLVIAKEMSEPRSLTIVMAMANLALTYERQGQLDKGLRLRMEAAEVSEAEFGRESLCYMTQSSNLAQSFANMGNYEMGAKMEIELWPRKKELLGPEHPETLSSLNNLAAIYLNQKRLDESAHLQRQHLDLVAKTQGDEAPGYLVSLGNLAVVHIAQRKYDDAVVLYEKALPLVQNMFGPDHPRTLDTMSNLAVAMGHQGRGEEAEQMLRGCLEMHRRIFEQGHPDTATYIFNLSRNLSRRGRREEALHLMIECFEMRVRLLGTNHSATQICLNKVLELRNPGSAAAIRRLFSGFRV